MATMVQTIIGAMIAAIVLFSAAMPTIISSYEEIKANLSSGEQAVAGLVTLFLLLGLAFGIGRGLGMF